MRLYHTLSFKLITSLFVALMAVSIGVVYVRVTAQNKVMEETIHVCAERASSFAKIALHQGMQENHPEVIQQTISQIGNASDIERISLYDKNGRIAYSSDSVQIGRIVRTEDEACAPCHGGRTDFTRTRSKEFVRIYNSPSGNRVLGLITPITNLPSCSDGGCHVHPPEQTVLGVLDVQMSLERMDAQAASLQTSVIMSILLTFIILAAGAGVFIYLFVHKPVQSLIAGTHRIATGDLGYKIPLTRKDELGLLVKSFNRMAMELQRSEAELVDWSNTLEEKVEKKTEELNKVQLQIMHMEKMASLGKLSSVIAHELNNPLAGILTYARLVEKRLGRTEITDELRGTMQQDVRLIAEESRRCGDIVKNLLFFARSREGEYRQADLNDVIEKTIRLVHHKIDLYDIRLEIHVPPETVLVTCDQNQIQQAVLALIINAIEAMPDGGRLTVGLQRENGGANIRISDTGIGISEEDQRRIFEPFFTTKEEGHGTGLGLSVAYGIVQSHDGRIRVESTLGRGSTFTVTLPISGPSTYFQEQA